MLIDLQFQYPVTYVMPRKRNSQTSYVKASATFVLREVADAPVVMRYRHSGHYQHIESIETAPLLDLVHDQETTWRNALFSDAKVTIDDLRAVISGGWKKDVHDDFQFVTWPFGPGNGAPHGSGRFDSIEALGAKTIFENGFDDVTRQIQETIDKFMLFDGHLYRKAPEPTLGTMNVRGNGRRFDIAAIPISSPEKIAEEKGVRADRLEQQVEIYRQGFGDEFDEALFRRNAPEVLRPDLLRYDDHAIGFRGVCRKLLSWTEDSVKHYSEVAPLRSLLMRVVPQMNEDLRSVVAHSAVVAEAMRPLVGLITEKASYISVGYAIRLAEEDLAERLRDLDAIDGVFRPFGTMKVTSTTFAAPMQDGADAASLREACIERGALEAGYDGETGEFSIRVEGVGDQASVLAASILEAAREAVYPQTGISFG